MATIVQRGKKFAVVYDYTTAAGEKKQKWESGLSKEQAKERKAEIEYLQQSQQFVTPTGKTVEDFMKEWVPVQARLKKWSYQTYTGNLSLIRNHILPHLGNKPIQKVCRRDIDLLYDKLSRTPKGAFKNGVHVIPEDQYKGLSPDKYLSTTTIKEVHDILKPFFRKAVEYKLIRENPVPTEGPKKRDDFERTIWDEDLMADALIRLESVPLLHLAIHCAFVGSLRNGEDMAITLDCIDLVRGRIYIDKTLQRVKKSALEAIVSDTLIRVFPTVMEGKKSCLILKAPKTKKSKRFVFMTDPLKEEITKRLEQIQADKERLGDKYNDYGLLFCLENGNPIEPKLIQSWFNDWQSDQGLSYPKLEFHGVRHSAATYKLELSDGDYKSVQGDTGHAKADTLLNIYAHTQDKRRQQLSRKFEQDFYNRQNSTSTIASNEQLFGFLLEKAQSDPNLQAELFELIKENPDLQRMALTAMVAMKKSS